MKPKNQQPIDYHILHALHGSPEGLIDAISPEIYRFLCGNVPSQDADDLLQDILIKVMTEINQLGNRNGFNAWTWRIVRNRIADHWREKQRRGMATIPEHTDGITACQDNDTPDSIAEQQEEVSLGHMAISDLSPLAKQVIHLYYWEHQSLAEISNVMQRPEGTIKRWLHEARQHIKGKLCE